MKRNNVFRLIYFLVLITFVVSGSALMLRLIQLHQGDLFYEQLGEVKTGSSLVPTYPIPDTETGESARLSPLSLSLMEFAGRYPDAAAWLQIPGTRVDYPVMLGGDNQFYLNHLPDGNKNALGSLFFDYRSYSESPHIIIYGHNGSGGQMFGSLKEYTSQDYWEEHSSITLASSDSLLICPIFSVRRVDTESGAYELEFANRQAFMDYISNAAAESLYPIEVDLTAAEKIITLSTCTSRRSQRLIVQAIVPSESSDPLIAAK